MDPNVNIRYIEPSAPSDRDQPVHQSWNQKSWLITLSPHKPKYLRSNADEKIDYRFDQIKTVEKSLEKLENSFNSY
jgi:hypothetical protein